MIKLIVEGMSCEHCMNRIKKSLLELEGVKTVDISLEDKTVTITNESDLNEKEIHDVIEDLGYDVINIK